MEPTNLHRSIGRLFHMRIPELMFRGRQETYKLVDRLWSHASDDRHLREVERLSRFLENAEKRFFAGPFDRNVPQRIATSHPDECQLLLASADRAFRGMFDLLGYRGLSFGHPIEWNLEPVAGRHTPLVHWTRIDPLDPSVAGDSKIVWELNRHQWLVRLAQAWRLTRDERFAESIVQHLRSWMRSNPVGIGINWASSLEVSFRLIAWCWTLVLIHDSRALTIELFGEIEDMLHAHAGHVERYLSCYFSPNTHLTGEALGLVYAGVVLAGHRRAERWRSLGARILNEEISRQVFPDGVYFEQSTCYQRYTIDIYLHFMLLAESNGLDVAPVVRQKVRSMVDVLVALRRPDGSMPSIGDEDGGQLLPLGSGEPHDHRATFSTAAVVFEEPAYAWAAGSFAPDTMWLLGSRAADRFSALPKAPPPLEQCRALPDGGIVAMRSTWDRDAHALLFDAGPLGCQYSSGHGHADLLSIQCSAFGEPLIVDAGTCCYTANPTLRNFFRGTTAHSTVMIDGKAQAQPAGAFSWRSRCAARLLASHCGSELSHASAESDAYRALPDPVVHRRRVVFVQARYWLVVDDLLATGTHQVDVRFQFAPVVVHAGEDGWVRARGSDDRGLLLRPFAPSRFVVRICEGNREPMEGWVSPHYGQLQPAPVVICAGTSELPVRIVTLLLPARDLSMPPEVSVESDPSGRAIAIRVDHDLVNLEGDEPSLARHP